MWSIYTMEYHSAVKRMMWFAATWRDLEIIILSETKDKHHMISLMCGI